MRTDFEYTAKNGKNYSVEVEYYLETHDDGYEYTHIEEILIYDETGLEVTPEINSRVYREIIDYVDSLSFEDDGSFEYDESNFA
jgi:hypothetical protein